MLLLPIITGILLVLPGPECSVVGSRNVAANEPLSDDEYLNRILRIEARYEKILEEKRRRDQQLKEAMLDANALDNELNLQVDDDVPLREEDTKDIQADTQLNTNLEAQNEQPSNQETTTGKQAAGNSDSTSAATKTGTGAQYAPPLPPQKQTHTETVISKDNFLFLAIITACSIAGLVGLIMAGVCWYKLHKKVKAASDVDYPAYGVTGPTKERLPSPGDRKLAQSAQMYHYQHQKQQMIAMEKANGEMKPDASEDESEEENEEGDYTVYECPGLAPTGEMEVRNPLFTGDAQTPVNGDTTVTNGLPEEHHDE